MTGDKDKRELKETELSASEVKLSKDTDEIDANELIPASSSANEASSNPVETKSGKKNNGPSMGKTFGLVAVLTVLSKIIGLVRDIVVAHAYGTGIVADAYNYAYLFTGNILILFGGLGGPFHSSTVAILTGRKEDKNAGSLILQISFFTFFALLAITVIAVLAAPFLASQNPFSLKIFDGLPPVFSSWLQNFGDYKIVEERLAPDLKHWTPDALKELFKQQMLDQFIIMSPLIVISGLVGISYGVLNVYNRIFWPSLSPAIASVAIIVAVLAFNDPQTAVYSGIPLAIGTLIGAVGQLAAQIPDLAKCKLGGKLSLLQPQEGYSDYTAMLWPAVFSTSVGQLIVYVDAFFTGALGQGAWTAVLMSNRLVQLPLGVLLTAMLVPILPRFTEQVDAGRIDDLKEELRRSLRFLWFLALPLTALFLVIPEPIIRLLFEGGQFDKNSTEMVTIALVFLAPSIFFYVARDLMTRVFYAFKDSNTPFRVAVIAIFVKAILDWYFVYHIKLDVRGISLASTLITILNLSLLTAFLKRRIGLLGFSKLVKPLAVMLFASGLCAVSAYAITYFTCSDQAIQTFAKTIPELSEQAARIVLFFGVGLASAAGAFLYLICCIMLGLEEPGMLAKRVPVLKKLVPKK